MTSSPEILRQIGNIARCAKVASVDLGARTCMLRFAADGDLVGPFPWLVSAAGETITWSAPSVGEQILLICPEADAEQGLVLRGLYSTAFPAPAADRTEMVRFKDGAVLTYDPEGHVLSVSLPAEGRVELTAPGGVNITADIQHTGNQATSGGITAGQDIHAEGDVTAGDKSLKAHRHTGVQAGAAVSGPPQ